MVPRLAAEAANGAVADRGPFGLGCSLPACDAAGYRHYLALVRLRLGDAVAFAALARTSLSLKNGSAGGDPISGAGERYFRCAA